jgi:hypothetical protein
MTFSTVPESAPKGCPSWTGRLNIRVYAELDINTYPEPTSSSAMAMSSLSPTNSPPQQQLVCETSTPLDIGA